jgi:hypothetical protein
MYNIPRYIETYGFQCLRHIALDVAIAAQYGRELCQILAVKLVVKTTSSAQKGEVRFTDFRK